MISQPPIQLITHSPVCKRSILLTIAYNSTTNEYPSPFPTLRILSPEKGMKWNIESGTISASFGNGPLNRTNISDSWIRVCVFNRILHESCSRAETNILNNTGKLKSDIYIGVARNGWIFPWKIHDGTRYTVSFHPSIWIRDDIPLCSGTDRIFKRSLNRLTVAW